MFKLIFIILVIPFVLSANNDLLNNIGVKAGFNLSSISTDKGNLGKDFNFNDHVGYKNGFNIGFVKTIKLNSNWELQAEILYTSKGYSFYYETKFYDTPYEVIHNMTISYFELPVIFCYNINMLKGLSFYAGGYFSLLIDSYLDIEHSATSTNDDKLNEISKNGLSGFDSGLIIGGKFKISSLFFDFRFSRGLVDINLQGTLSKSHKQNDTKNKQFSFSIGYFF